MMSEKYYYHLTTPENISSIMRDGLKPMLGERSLSIKEDTPALCLCSKKGIDAWSILLGLNTVLKVMIPSEDNLIQVSDYADADEYRYNGIIPPECIIETYKIRPSKKTLETLRFDYVENLSEFCVLCARYYTEGTGWNNGDALEAEIKEDIQILGEALIPVIPRLKYQESSRKDKRVMLKQIGAAGGYSFCDDYCPGYGNSKPIKRLYQKLIEYPNDEFTEIRKKIYNIIKSNFKYCLRTNTGGWTG